MLVGLGLIGLVLIGYWIGYFKARYNIEIVTESRWEQLTRAESAIQEMQAKAEREANLNSFNGKVDYEY